jgi:hypothetical protein
MNKADSWLRRRLARKPILVLLEESGVRIGRATQTLSARLADATVATHLDVAVGSALLAVHRLVLDADGAPTVSPVVDGAAFLRPKPPRWLPRRRERSTAGCPAGHHG